MILDRSLPPSRQDHVGDPTPHSTIRPRKKHASLSTTHPPDWRLAIGGVLAVHTRCMNHRFPFTSPARVVRTSEYIHVGAQTHAGDWLFAFAYLFQVSEDGFFPPSVCPSVHEWMDGWMDEARCQNSLIKVTQLNSTHSLHVGSSGVFIFDCQPRPRPTDQSGCYFTHPLSLTCIRGEKWWGR